MNSAVETSMSAGQLAAMIWARWRLIALSVIAMTALALLVTLILPKTYVASSDVYVDYQSNDPVSTRQFSPMLDENYMEDQIALITSYEVANRVVRMLKLNEDPTFVAEMAKLNDAQRLRAYRELINSVSRRIDVVARGSTRVLEIRFRAGGADSARDGANAAVQAYLDLTAEIASRTGRERLALYDRQLDDMRLQADAAQQKLDDFQRSQGLILTGTRENVTVGDLSDALSKLVSVQVERQRAQARWEAVDSLIKSGAAPDQVPDIAARGDIATLKGKLTDIERLLASARGPGVLGSANPQLRALESERASLRRDLTAQSRQALDGLRLLPQELIAQERSLQAEVDQRRQDILKTQESSSQMESLLRQLQSAKQTYDSASQRYGDLLIATNVAQRNLVVLRAAQTPETHNRPSRRINTLAGLMAGLFAGLGLALFLELGNRRVRCRDDIERTVGVPLIGTLAAGRRKEAV